MADRETGDSSPSAFTAGQRVWAKSQHGKGFWRATLKQFHEQMVYVTVIWDDPQGYEPEEKILASDFIACQEGMELTSSQCQYLADSTAVRLHNEELRSASLLRRYIPKERHKKTLDSSRNDNIGSQAEKDQSKTISEADEKVVMDVLQSSIVCGNLDSWGELNGRSLDKASIGELMAERLSLEQAGINNERLLAILGMLMMHESSGSVIENLARRLQKHCLILRENTLSKICSNVYNIAMVHSQSSSFPTKELNLFVNSVQKTSDDALAAIRKVLDWRLKDKESSLHASLNLSCEASCEELEHCQSTLIKISHSIESLKSRFPHVVEKVVRGISAYYTKGELLHIPEIACAIDLTTLQQRYSRALHAIYPQLWSLLSLTSVDIVFMEVHCFLLGSTKMCLVKWTSSKPEFHMNCSDLRNHLTSANLMPPDCLLFSFPLFSVREILQSRQVQHSSLQKNRKRCLDLLNRNLDSLKELLAANSAHSGSQSKNSVLACYCTVKSVPYSADFSLDYNFNLSAARLQEYILRMLDTASTNDYISSDASAKMYPAEKFVSSFDIDFWRKEKISYLQQCLTSLPADFVQVSFDIYGSLNNADKSVVGCDPVRVETQIPLKSRTCSTVSTRALLVYSICARGTIAEKELIARLSLNSGNADSEPQDQKPERKAFSDEHQDENAGTKQWSGPSGYDSYGEAPDAIPDYDDHDGLDMSLRQDSSHKINSRKDIERLAIGSSNDSTSAIVFSNDLISQLNANLVLRYLHLDIDDEIADFNWIGIKIVLPNVSSSRGVAQISKNREPATVTYGTFLKVNPGIKNFCFCTCEDYQCAISLHGFEAKYIYLDQKPAIVHDADRFYAKCSHVYTAIQCNLQVMLEKIRKHVILRPLTDQDMNVSVSVQVDETLFAQYRAMSLIFTKRDGRDILNGTGECRIPIVKLYSSSDPSKDFHFFSVDAESLGVEGFERHAIVKCSPIKHFQIGGRRLQMMCLSCHTLLWSLVCKRSCPHIKLLQSSESSDVPQEEVLLKNLDDKRRVGGKRNASEATKKSDFFDTDLANKYKENHDGLPHTGYVLGDATYTKRQHELEYKFENSSLKFGWSDAIVKSMDRQHAFLNAQSQLVTLGGGPFFSTSNDFLLGTAQDLCPCCACEKTSHCKTKTVVVYTADCAIVHVQNVKVWICPTCGEVSDDGYKDSLWYLSSTFAVHEQVLWDCLTLMFNGHIRNLQAYCAVCDLKVKTRMQNIEASFMSQKSFTTLFMNFISLSIVDFRQPCFLHALQFKGMPKTLDSPGLREWIKDVSDEAYNVDHVGCDGTTDVFARVKSFLPQSSPDSRIKEVSSYSATPKPDFGNQRKHLGKEQECSQCPQSFKSMQYDRSPIVTANHVQLRNTNGRPGMGRTSVNALPEERNAAEHFVTMLRGRLAPVCGLKGISPVIFHKKTSSSSRGG